MSTTSNHHVIKPDETPRYADFEQYGLSMSNHWPSMMVLFPVFAYLGIKYSSKLSAKNYFFTIFLLFLGLSSYLYLPIRSGCEGSFIFMEKADTAKGFWNTIFRTGYVNTVPPSVEIYLRQIYEFFWLFLNNFSYLWPLVFIGGFYMYKKNIKLFFFYSAIFFITSIFIVLVNRSSIELMWVEHVFLLPATYVSLLLIIPGINFAFQFIKSQTLKISFLVLIIALIGLCCITNYRSNNSRDNYISYDFGNNILKTMNPNSFYFVAGDYYAMPLLYLDYVCHETNNVTIQPLYNLQFRFQNYGAKYDFKDINENDFKGTTTKLMDFLAEKANVYITGFTNNPNEAMENYTQKTDGIISRLIQKKHRYIAEHFQNIFLPWNI